MPLFAPPPPAPPPPAPPRESPDCPSESLPSPAPPPPAPPSCSTPVISSMLSSLSLSLSRGVRVVVCAATASAPSSLGCFAVSAVVDTLPWGPLRLRPLFAAAAPSAAAPLQALVSSAMESAIPAACKGTLLRHVGPRTRFGNNRVTTNNRAMVTTTCTVMVGARAKRLRKPRVTAVFDLRPRSAGGPRRAPRPANLILIAILIAMLIGRPRRGPPADLGRTVIHIERGTRGASAHSHASGIRVAA